jgi:hypothetical protein
MALSGTCIYGAIELNGKGIRCNFVSVAGATQREVQFKIKSSGEIIHTGRGNTDDEAFDDAYNSFDQKGLGRSPKQIQEDEKVLRDRVEDLESQLDIDETASDEKDESDTNSAPKANAKKASRKKKS